MEIIIICTESLPLRVSPLAYISLLFRFIFLLLLYRYISARFVAFDLKRIVDYDEGNQAVHSHSNLDAHIHISIMNVFISKAGI